MGVGECLLVAFWCSNVLSMGWIFFGFVFCLLSIVFSWGFSTVKPETFKSPLKQIQANSKRKNKKKKKHSGLTKAASFGASGTI